MNSEQSQSPDGLPDKRTVYRELSTMLEDADITLRANADEPPDEGGPPVAEAPPEAACPPEPPGLVPLLEQEITSKTAHRSAVRFDMAPPKMAFRESLPIRA